MTDDEIYKIVHTVWGYDADSIVDVTREDKAMCRASYAAGRKAALAEAAGVCEAQSLKWIGDSSVATAVCAAAIRALAKEG